MQIQIFEANTGNIVAWIDTDNLDENILHKDYDMIIGNDLNFCMIGNRMKIRPQIVIND